MWKWIHCGKSESQAQFGLVVGVSDNSSGSKIPNLESFWGLGQEEHQVWSPCISPFMWWFCVSLCPGQGLFYTQGIFCRSLVDRSWSLGDEPFPAGSFLCSLEVSYFIFFSHKSCPLAILCCSFFIPLGYVEGLGGINLSYWKLQVDQSREEGTPALPCL